MSTEAIAIRKEALKDAIETVMQCRRGGIGSQMHNLGIDNAVLALKLLLAEMADSTVVDDYVGWCRYKNHGQNEYGADITTFEACDSDSEGAFKVYRRFLG